MPPYCAPRISCSPSSSSSKATNPPPSTSPPDRIWSQWAHTLGQPKIGLLDHVFFLATFCFSCFESTLPLLVSDNFHLDIQSDATTATTVIYLFVFCGIIGAFVQGGMIGRIVKKMGEPKVIVLSLVLTAVSLAMLPFIKVGTPMPLTWKILLQPEGLPWVMMLAALAVLSIGSSLTRPPLFGLLSNLTSASEQGANLGVAQAPAAWHASSARFSPQPRCSIPRPCST